MGSQWTRFSNEVAAADDAAARELVLSLIGSKHRANRRQIKIETVEPISGDAITDIVVQKKVSGAAE